MSRVAKIALWEPAWILILAPAVLLPGRFVPMILHPVIMFLLFLGWPLRLVANHRLSIRTPLDWPITLILLWLPVALWVSVDKVRSWESVGYLIFGVTLYFAMINWPPSQRRPQLIAWLIILIGTLVALLGLVTLSYQPTKLFQTADNWLFFQPVVNRLEETIHPNVLAGMLVTMLPILAALSLNWSGVGSGRARWVFIALLLLGLGVVTLSQSRGGYLAVAISLGIVYVLRWPRLLYSLPVLVMLTAGGVYWIGFERVLEFVSESGGLGGLDGRIELWSRALYALSDFSFTGVGIGMFQQIIPLLYPFFLLSPESAPHAHNLYLQIGLDLGLPGLVAWLALIINVFALLIPVLRRRDRILQWALASGVLGGLVAMLVHGFLDAVTWGTKLAFYPWLLIALAVLLGLQLQQEEAPRP